MKQIITALVISLITFSAFSQQPVGNGGNQLNAGFGSSSRGLPIYIGFDHGLKNDLSVGAEFSFRGYNERYLAHRYHHNIFGISGNFNYHFNRIFNLPSEWNIYLGLNVGFNFWSSPNGYLGEYASGLGLGAQVGARYFFTDKFGINLEIVGGNAVYGGKFGITIML